MESLMQSNKTDWEKIYVETGKEISGETTGQFRLKRETCWWNEKVQQVIREIKQHTRNGNKMEKKLTEKHTNRRGKKQKQ